MADLVIRCHERDLALSLELAANLPVQRLLVGLDHQQEVGPLLLELPKNGCWVCMHPPGSACPPDPARQGSTAAPPARGSHRWRSRPD